MDFKPSLPLLAAAVAFSLSACTEQEIAEYCAANPNDSRCSSVQPSPTPSPAITPDNATIDSVNGAANAALKAGEANTVRFTIYDDGKPLSGSRAVDVSIVHYNGNVQGTFSNGAQKIATTISNGSGSFVITPAAGGKISVRLTVVETGDYFTRNLNVAAASTPVNPSDPCANVGNPGKMSTTQPVTQAEKCAILKAHNDARAAENAGLPALKWNDTLASQALEHSKKCTLAHASGISHGENLFWGTPGGYSVADGVNYWVEERKYYNGQPISADASFNKYGHYTQIVWKGTTEVGCGYARCGSWAFMTCRYNPRGNIIGQKPF
ncbi:MAG: hypothetical protein IJS87_07880 [Rhodocyclaceae bacterium]|nr:hypothetical protein [Rhodocyclaceae bacterium]